MENKGRGNTPLDPELRNRNPIGIMVNDEVFAIIEGICKEYNVYKSALVRGIIVSFLRKKGLLEEQKSFDTSLGSKDSP